MEKHLRVRNTTPAVLDVVGDGAFASTICLALAGARPGLPLRTLWRFPSGARRVGAQGLWRFGHWWYGPASVENTAPPRRAERIDLHIHTQLLRGRGGRRLCVFLLSSLFFIRSPKTTAVLQ
ncbi:hypothetical protein RJO15_05755 [Herbaspirillum huttiense F1]|uniref:hypothetical protein n=1 Tax=Herbaspirillum TaxID=963 RepID=UPI001064ACB7|nr:MULTISPECIES: hypothetical protein [Herbaspirillum]MBP1313460.1 hypothetical protein [Herbaspirillum sp. 1130]MDT0355269.1 hypothetical protein [Herbaspirillum huttiense F1]